MIRQNCSTAADKFTLFANEGEELLVNPWSLPVRLNIILLYYAWSES